MFSFSNVIIVSALGNYATSAWIIPSIAERSCTSTSLQASRRGFLNNAAMAFAATTTISVPVWAGDEVESIKNDPEIGSTSSPEPPKAVLASADDFSKQGQGEPQVVLTSSNDGDSTSLSAEEEPKVMLASNGEVLAMADEDTYREPEAKLVGNEAPLEPVSITQMPKEKKFYFCTVEEGASCRRVDANSVPPGLMD